MAESTISGLEPNAVPDPSDLILTSDGVDTYRTTLQQSVVALPVSTPSAKGLMSAADKAALDALIASVLSLGTPQVANIVAGSNIVLPAPTTGTYTVVILTGTTTINTVSGSSSNRLYIIRYPAGAGVMFIDQQLYAGDAFPYIAI